MKNLIDFSSLTMDSLHVTSKNLEIYNYDKIAKHFKVEIDLLAKSNDSTKKPIRKKLQLILETGVNQFLKDTDKTKVENINLFKNWLNAYCSNFTNFETFDKLLLNSNLLIIKNNIAILKKYLKF